MFDRSISMAAVNRSRCRWHATRIAAVTTATLAFDFIAKALEAVFLARIDGDINQGKFFSRDALLDLDKLFLGAAAFVGYAKSFEPANLFLLFDEHKFLSRLLANRLRFAITAFLRLADYRASEG